MKLPKIFVPVRQATLGVSAERRSQTGFALTFVCLLVIGIVSYESVNRLRENADLSRHTEEVISSLRLLLSHVTDAESSQRGYAITRDESYLEPYHEAQRKVETDLWLLRHLTQDNAPQLDRLNAMAPIITERMTRLREAVGVRRDQGFDAVRAVTMTGNGKRLHDQLRNSIKEMEDAEVTLMRKRQADTQRSSVRARGIIIGGSLLALGSVGLSLLFVGKDFTRRRATASQAVLAGQLGHMGAWAVELPEYRQTWSDEVCAIHEVPPGTTLSVAEAIDSYAPESRETITRVFNACVREGTRYDVELPIITARGRRVWVRSIGEAKRNAAGVIVRIQGALQDITVSRQGVEALQRQQAELRILFDLMPVMIWFKDTNNIILRINQRAADAVGRPISEIEGKSAGEIYLAQSARFHESEREVIDSGLPRLAVIEPLTDSQGRERWIETDKVPVHDKAGKVVGIVIMAQDITARRESVEALRESETRFRELAENIDEVFWIADPKSPRKIYISPAYEKIWGRSCQSAYESPHMWLEAVHLEDRERVLQALRTKQTHGTYDEEYRIVRPDGTERWIRDRAFPVRDADGAIKRWVGVAEDTTQYRQMEEQFRQAQKMEAIGTLAGGIAHDFNNILAAILGYTELSRMILKKNPKVRAHLGAVLQATGRATDLVRQILTFSRQQPLVRRPIHLRPVVAECLELLRSSIPSTITFDVSLATDTPIVLADPTQIHQILMNLGTNASHAMKDRPGRLRVKMERCALEDGQLTSQTRLQPGLYVHISVGDNGSGMDKATLRRIFEPFFTTKCLGEGTGLGLAVVHGIMDSHLGAITVESEPGEGTTFHLYFPAHLGEATEATSDDGPVPRGHGERLLFVDDENLLVHLGRMELISLGYEVEIATQPDLALAWVRAEPQRFALVLTDLTMPVMNGLVLAGELKKIRPSLPVILMTGYSGSITPGQMDAAGICQLLLKPTGLHSLGSAVHAALSHSPTWLS